MVSGTRGTVIKNKDLSQVTWLRVGGPADLFFMPADIEDLIKFLGIEEEKSLKPDISSSQKIHAISARSSAEKI